MFKQSALKFCIIVSLSLSAAPAAFALIVNSPLAITHIVTVQPIIVSDDDGGNTATFFGTTSQQSAIEGFVDQIWAQAGIDVNFLGANLWNHTFANWGSGGPTTTVGDGERPVQHLSMISGSGRAAGVAHNPSANIINMYFGNIAAGFALRSQNSVAGLAYQPGENISLFVGSNLLSSNDGREAIAGVVAHEIGHNLGLSHTNDRDPNNDRLLVPQGLMTSGGGGDRLTSVQASTALRSDLAVAAVPVPAAIWFLGSGLLLLFHTKKQPLVS